MARRRKSRNIWKSSVRLVSMMVFGCEVPVRFAVEALCAAYRTCSHSLDIDRRRIITDSAFIVHSTSTRM